MIYAMESGEKGKNGKKRNKKIDKFFAVCRILNVQLAL